MNNASRYFWSALALLDAFALAWVASQVNWLDFETIRVGETPAGWLIVAAVYAMDIAFKLIAAVFVASVAYAIVREFMGGWTPGRITRVFVSLVLVAILGIALYLALVALLPIIGAPEATYIDRLQFFDRLARASPLQGATIGAYLAALCVTVYLAEKYFFRWWGRHWALSVAAIAILAWPAWTVMKGEQRQKDWVGSQQWNAVNVNQTWLEALAACKALGPAWRLPSRSELSLYASVRPEAIREWQGPAWTQTSAESGRWAVVVDLVPRQSGMWRSNSTPWRDRSVCEGDASPGRSVAPQDWFSELREPLCNSTDRSPGLYPSGLRLLANVRGSAVGGPEPALMTTQAQASTICVNAVEMETRLPLRGRGYPREKDYTDLLEFLASMREACQPRAPGSDAAACAAFAGDPAKP
jgi:hypothetical protein